MSASNPTLTAGHTCSSLGCGKPATLLCPKCNQLELEPTYFCDQECFTKSWKDHIRVHKIAEAKKAFRPPGFAYTGPLRPHYVTPMRDVPDHIEKPEYALTGTPVTEMKLKESTKIYINSKEEVEGIRVACRMGREILDIAGKMVRPGITTEEIDKVVHEETIKRNAYPSPLNYHFFPKSCCTSVNEVICHGIPDTRPLEEGDIVNIDISVFYKGYHGDLNETFCVGKVDDASKLLIKTTYEALMNAIAEMRSGALVRDFGTIISKTVNTKGFQVVKSYCGHGIGKLFHGSPNVPHYARNKAVGVLRPGMVLTIEPMINAGTWKDETWPDNWTSVTIDGKRSAQFEHTILVTEAGYEILTARNSNSPPLFWENPSPTKTLTTDSKEKKILQNKPVK